MRGFPRKAKTALFHRDRSSERPSRRSLSFTQNNRPTRLFRLHPLFLLVGVWYAFSGELFLFFVSTIVAVQHEYAHALASRRLGYTLNSIVLMPFGAVIDGDVKGISFKDEIFVALAGPLCNLLTAVLFVALWWFAPTMYAFTDVAYYSSLSVAFVNLLPAYPLDGGRVLHCALARAFSKRTAEEAKAEKRARQICLAVTLAFAVLFLTAFLVLCFEGEYNLSLFVFSLFLLFGGLGNRDKTATYDKIDFTFRAPLSKGVEIRRVAVSKSCAVKDVFRFLARGSYLVLEVYDEGENHLFDLTQNELSYLFSCAKTPYDSLGALREKNLF